MEINQIAPQTYSPETQTRSQERKEQGQELGNAVEQAAQAKRTEAEAQKKAEQEAAAEQQKQQQAQQPVSKMAKELQGLADSLGRSVQFSVNEESGDDIIMVFHKKTKELIRQIPSEEVVEMRERLSKVFGSIIEEQI